MRRLIFARCSMLLFAAVFACAFPPVASIDILSVYPSSIYAGTPAQLQLQVDPSSFSIPKIADVSIGGFHTCASTTSGALYCWGRGDYGQVGNGRSDRMTSRPALVLSSGVVTVSLGEFFACALTVNSSVICFGRNNYGQLGDGTTTNRNTPVRVTRLPSNAVAIACGDSFACVLNSTGNILCWGSNNYGQLGDGSTTSQSIPTPVPNLPHIAAIGLGHAHSCALGSASTGILYCWGWNMFGQIGHGSMTTVIVKSPTQVIGLGPVSSFALGGAVTCAANFSHVHCWGWNAAGQLGDGTFIDRAMPSAVQHSGMGTSRKLSVGDLHACAIDTSNLLWCWGRVNHSRIRASSDQNRGFFESLAEPAVSAVRIVPLPSESDSLACGDMNTCIVSLFNGTLLCWGANHYGQVGDGTTLDTVLPTSVFESCSSPAVGSIISGLRCIRSDSNSLFTVSVGSSSLVSALAAQSISYYLGPFQFTSRNLSSMVTVLDPQALTSLTPSVVFTSSSSAIVLTVAGRGFGPEGGAVTLGRIGTFTAGLSFRVVSDTVVTVRVDVGSAGSVASAAALDVEFFVNGLLFKSGLYGDSSRLMLKTALAVVSPSSVYTSTDGKLTFIADQGFGVQSCSMGQYHSCAVMIGGLLLCWGDSANGKLGSADGARTPSLPVSGFADPVLLVSAGSEHTCVITVKRDALCFGRNEFGQLGDGSLTSSSMPVLVAGGHKWLHLHASIHITCGVTIAGAVYCWGRDEYGQGGSGAIVTATRPVPSAVVALSSIFSSVSCSVWACCALHVNGQLWCWGDSRNGELGQDNSLGSGVPVDVTVHEGTESSFTSVSAGVGHFCAISASFQVWCWGSNDVGQSGMPSTEESIFWSPNLVMNTPAFVSHVAAGSQHSCAGNASVLVCWGSNSNGQLGDGSALTADHPPSIVPLPLLTTETILSVSCNTGWSVGVVTSFNRMFVWGSNVFSHLGDGLNEDRRVPMSNLFPVSSLRIGASSKFDSLSWIGRSTFAVQFNSRSFLSPSNGDLLCSFSLGPFAFASANASSRVTVFAPQALTSLTPSVVFTNSSSAVVLTVAGRGFGPEGGAVTLGRIGTFTAGLSFRVVSDTVVTVRVDVGSAGSVASAAALDVEFFVNGLLFKSGLYGDSSRLMLKTALAVVSPSSVYTSTDGKLTFIADQGFGVQSCSMGQYHSCAVMIGGLLLCWGDSANGKLGSADGARTPSLPVSGFADPVLLVSAGSEHTCVITVKRDALCFGRNEFGQLGDGSLTSSSMPVLVAGGHKWLHLHASIHITCGVTIAGAVYCWGRDEYGQGGSGAIVTATRPVPSAVVALSSIFSSVSCSVWACCALHVNGQLWCWGDSRNGELGQDNSLGSGVPVDVTVHEGTESSFTSVSAGVGHFCAISASFQVWCWGSNDVGQSGMPSTEESIFWSPNLVMNTPAFVSHVAAGSQHSCAGNASVLVCWGSNSNGQLGDGSALTADHPPSIVPLPLLTTETILSVSCNTGWSVGVVTSFNRMFVWGSNVFSHLGDGLNEDRRVPMSNLFPVSSLRIGASSKFDSLSWIGRSTFAVQFNSRSFLSPSNGDLLCSFSLGPFAFASANASSRVTVFAPQALTSLTPSVVFTNSSSAVVLTVAGRGFGPEGGAVTLGRIGTFTAGLSFRVVSDTVVTVRVDVGSAGSVASAAALDVEFFVNGFLFRSSSPESRLIVYQDTLSFCASRGLSVNRSSLSAASLPHHGLAFFAGGILRYNDVRITTDAVDIFNASSPNATANCGWTTGQLSQSRSYIAVTTLPLNGLVFFAGGSTWRSGFSRKYFFILDFLLWLFDLEMTVILSDLFLHDSMWIR
jgi:alpha-tubulin suppressor-like RCC1 family protein